jgi:hypothetical protein
MHALIMASITAVTILAVGVCVGNIIWGGKQ